MWRGCLYSLQFLKIDIYIYNLQSRNCVVDVFFKVSACVCVCVQDGKNTDLNPATLTIDSFT